MCVISSQLAKVRPRDLVQDYLGNQRKVWNGDWPLDAAQQPPMIAAGQRVSVRQGDPPSLPYPMQFGAGFWLCSESNAPALSPNGV